MGIKEKIVKSRMQHWCYTKTSWQGPLELHFAARALSKRKHSKKEGQKENGFRMCISVRQQIPPNLVTTQFVQMSMTDPLTWQT